MKRKDIHLVLALGSNKDRKIPTHQHLPLKRMHNDELMAC